MERWISFLQSYSEILTGASVIVLGLILTVILVRILRQIKRLNTSLLSITKNVQAYFDVIMQEDVQEQEETREPEVRQNRRTDETEDAAQREHRKQEEEALFNSVLQEYFS